MSTALVAQNKFLYVIVAVGTMILWLAALGPGLYNEPLTPWVSWQHLLFNDLCHQNPLRSFTINGTPMAVCGRCFGIYSSFLVGWLLMPLFVYFIRDERKLVYKLFIGAILLNLLDVGFNLTSVWSNTLNSRFVFGAMLGLITAMLLMDEFYQLKTQE